MKCEFRRSAPMALGLLSVSLAALVCLGACGRKGGGVVRAILCGSGHAKGLMSVGINLEPLGALGVKTSNAGLREEINGLLSKAGLDTSIIHVKGVESVDKSSDDDSSNSESIRFLELGGALGGLGTATSYLMDAARQSFGAGNLNGTDFFTFARESFRVSSAVQLPDPREEEFRRLFAPHLELAAAPQYPDQQWAYRQTDFSGAITALESKVDKNRDIVVAVVDTGVDLEHPALKDILVAGKNFVEPGKPPQDGNGHGTHCAGIIAAQGGGGGVPVGVAASVLGKRIKIMPVKVLGDNGSGDSQAVEKGIRWAVANKADVISMSLGGGRDYSDARKEGLKDEVIADALKNNVIVIVAAGNESCPLGGKCGGQGIFSTSFEEYIVHPCSYEGTICVGATDADEKLASYSNYSSGKSGKAYRVKADVNAPGTNIYSTWPVALSKGEPYKAISGTSMATPYVAGLAALVRSANPKATQDDVMKILRESQAYSQEVKEKSGEGRVDFRALADKVAGTASPAKPQPKPVEDPNRSEDGQPLGLVSLWQAICSQ